MTLTFCANSDVDASLRAILRAGADETFDSTCARTIQAASCLSDEPNASDECAAEIVNALCVNASSVDPSYYNYRSIERSALLISSSRWSPILNERLLAQFFGNERDSRGIAGSIIGAIYEKKVLNKEDLTKLTREAIDAVKVGNEQEAALYSLGVMNAAYNRRVPLNEELTDALFSRISGAPAPALAALWALAWLSTSCDWRPSRAQAAALLEIVKDRTHDCEQVRWTFWILTQYSGDESSVDISDLDYWYELNTKLMRNAIARYLSANPKVDYAALILKILETNDVMLRNEVLRKFAIERVSDPIDQTLLLIRNPRLGTEVALDPDSASQASAALGLSVEEILRRYAALGADDGSSRRRSSASEREKRRAKKSAPR